MRRYIIGMVLTVIGIAIFSFLVTYGVGKLKIENMNYTLFSWLFNMLFTIGGISFTHNSLIAKQNEAVYGFYIGMINRIKSLEHFLGNGDDWKNTDVFWIMVNKNRASESGRETINPQTLNHFKETSDEFYTFINNAANNVPPDGDAKAWIEHQKILTDFLYWGKNCENADKKDEESVETYYKNLIKSKEEISRKIEKCIDKKHKRFV